jgi:hypothetical protein
LLVISLVYGIIGGPQSADPMGDRL